MEYQPNPATYAVRHGGLAGAVERGELVRHQWTLDGTLLSPEDFAARRGVVAVELSQLEAGELQYRQVPRAVALLAEVQAAMYGAAPVAPAAAPTPPATGARQPGLWEQPPAPVPSPVAAPVAQPRPATPAPAPASPPTAKPPQPPAPLMPVEDAYKLLKATAGSTWESIEQTRRQLVQQSHPARLKTLSPERRTQAPATAAQLTSV